jgi:hypothetical protein
MYLEAAALVTAEVMHVDGGRNVALWALGGNEPLAVSDPYARGDSTEGGSGQSMFEIRVI